nr:DUF1003 domain-containing protein [uncultured Leptotrichia sp.]
METLREETNSKNNALKKDNKEKNQEENKNSEINIKNIQRNMDLKKEKPLKSILENIERDEKAREIIIRRLLDQKVSKDIKEEESKSISGKLSNFLANIVGSKTFILLLTIFVIAWFVYNVSYFKENKDTLSLVNIGLSGVMMLFSSLIILGQNRKKRLEEKKLENDYKVNLKNEIVIEDLHYKLDEMLKKQEEISDRVSSLEGNPEPMKKRSEKKYKFIDIVDK